MKSLILLACLLQTAFAAPQLITFKDGKVGVNFFGYHAEAGLGGGQNGQNGGLLGGLHASAGTPWGQNAAAGLGGNVNGRAAGVLYAGAQATPDVGASAVLGGDTSQGGFSGTDAYANGKVSSRTRTIVAGNTQKRHEVAADSQLPPQPVTENVNAIQKIRPPKKYYSSESYDFVNSDANSFNNGVALYTNKTKNLYDIEQEKPVTAASIVITKTINKTNFITPFHTDVKNNIAPSAPVQSLNINANDRNNRHHNHFNSNEFNTTTSVSSVSSALTPTPDIIHSSVVLEENLPPTNGDISKGTIAQGVVNDGATATTAVIITRDRTKLRTRQHPHKHRRNHHNHNLNRQRQRSKTIVKVVEQQQQQKQPSIEQQHHYTQELFPIETKQQQQQIYHQQQRPVRRQLIAPPPAPHDLPAPPCDTTKEECKNVHREVRSDVVQNALQIPIGILQSLQHSLGNLRSGH